MKKKRPLWISLFAVVVISVALLGATLAAGWSPKLGLDLDGGLSVVYKTARPVNSGELNTVINIMDQRLSGLGASGAQVAAQGSNQIAVSVPGAKDTQRILDSIGSTAQLYFRPALCYAPSAKAKGAKPATNLPSCSSASQINPTSLGLTTASSSGQYRQPPPDQAFAAYQSTTRSQDTQKATVLLPFNKAAGQTGRMVLGPAPMTGKAIKSASAQLSSQTGQWSVVMNLTGKGSTEWDNFAQKQFHSVIAMDLDAEIISAPVTQPRSSAFSSFGGTVQISGSFTATQAKTLATQLNYGALPVPLNRLTVQTISPTLGKSSLDAGLIAGLAGLALVMLYIILYYRMLGFVVLAGLVVTAALLWAIISIMGQSGTTIDLAGVIGIIVSIGITVDSYIVYFERLKDETRSGRTVRTSVDRGFKSAFRTVLAADAVSFMGAAILYWISVGPVKGFALFLGLSTLIDVFVTYFFTRPFVALLGTSSAATEAKGMGVARGLGVGTEGAP